MCGRFTLHTPREVLSRRFEVDLAEDLELRARYNIAPTERVLAVRVASDGRRRAELLRWGLVPAWAHRLDELPGMINARAETAATRPAYRDSFRSRRCLILADGFYEWKPSPAGGPKTPYWISLASGEPFAMAGLWAIWQRRDDLFDREPLRSCSILTTASNPLVGPIHERMPVILHPEAESSWLDHALDGRTAELRDLLVPVPAEALRARPVSFAVNSTRNDGPHLIRETDDPRAGFGPG